MNLLGTGIDLADLPHVVGLPTRLDRDGWMAGAIARLERGDIERGLRAAEAALRTAEGASVDMVNSYEEGGR